MDYSVRHKVCDKCGKAEKSAHNGTISDDIKHYFFPKVRGTVNGKAVDLCGECQTEVTNIISVWLNTHPVNEPTS